MNGQREQNLTVERVEEVRSEYLKDFKEGSGKAIKRSNTVSKAA